MKSWLDFFDFLGRKDLSTVEKFITDLFESKTCLLPRCVIGIGGMLGYTKEEIQEEIKRSEVLSIKGANGLIYWDFSCRPKTQKMFISIIQKPEKIKLDKFGKGQLNTAPDQQSDIALFKDDIRYSVKPNGKNFMCKELANEEVEAVYSVKEWREVITYNYEEE